MNDENQNEYVIDRDGDKIFLEDDGSLDLEWAVYYDLSDLVGLSELKTVKTIYLSNCGKKFDALKPLKSLERIYIRDDRDTPLKLGEFSGMTHLKELVLRLTQANAFKMV